MRTSEKDTQVLAKRSWKLPGAYVAASVLALVFSVATHGDVTIRLNDKSQSYTIPDIVTSGAPIVWVLVALTILVTACAVIVTVRRIDVPSWARAVGMSVVGVSTILGFLLYAGSDSAGAVTLTSTLVSTVAISTPLIFGSLSGVISERVGVVNIAIEGDLLAGQYASLFVTVKLDEGTDGKTLNNTASFVNPPEYDQNPDNNSAKASITVKHRLAGKVYYDANDSSSYTNGEEGFKDITVELLGPDGAVIATTTTATDGKRSVISRIASPLFLLITFHFVAFCWIFFRSRDFDIALTIIHNIGDLSFNWQQWHTIIMGYKNVFLLMAIGYVWHFFPQNMNEQLKNFFGSMPILFKAVIIHTLRIF